jgi:UPF0755 protein
MSLIPQLMKRPKKHRPLNSFITKLIINGVIIAAFMVAAQLLFQIFELNGDSNTENRTIEVQIPPGASTNTVATILKEKGLIKSTLVFKILSKINEKSGVYQQGKHVLNTSMDHKAIIKELKKSTNQFQTIAFTIPEGFELRQIADRLANMGLIDKERFIKITQTKDFDYWFLKNIPDRKNKLEGYLFPDTYEVYTNVTEEEIILKMLDRFEQIFTRSDYERTKELGMTVDEVITLASIIEREAKIDKDRPLISAVFHNRLNSKEYPFLQSCATIQYILGERKPILSVEDTKINSPYNTYMNSGLPIGPIASPGKASIQAALYPADVDYLFFVANSDGSHKFSKTYQEHLKASKNTK